MVNSELILIKAFFLIVEELVIIHCTSLKAENFHRILFLQQMGKHTSLSTKKFKSTVKFNPH